MRLYNTLSKKVEDFVPLHPDLVSVYCCGPTVYDYAHIGNFRTYTMSDVLVRTLRYHGYTVKYVMNMTDVGHLVSDSDTGIDKLEKGARREGKTAWEIAQFYIDKFLDDSRKLNLLEPDVRPKPTSHIAEQIDMVKTLLEKGFAYKIDDGIYFDTSKFPKYGELGVQSLTDKKAGARVEVNPQKRNPQDFALWKLSPISKGLHGKSLLRDMEWASPWGVGFPGWHIECSAMSIKYLGPQIDIHSGGADLIPIHHTNEIAQSEAATGVHPFVRYWVHGQFILSDNEKMSKSKGNFYRVADVIEKGFDPLALRYLYFSAHYRSFLSFTWTALESAFRSLEELRRLVSALARENRSVGRTMLSPEKLAKTDSFSQKFRDAVADDLNMPEALSVVWQAVKSNIPGSDKLDLLLEFDQVLGLNIGDINAHITDISALPPEITALVQKRDDLRMLKKFEEADKVRIEIESRGYSVEDSPTGTLIKKK